MPTVCSGSSRLLRVSADLQRLRIAEDSSLGKQIAFLLKAHGFRLQEQRHGQLSSQCGDMADNLPRQRTVISDNDCIRTVLRQPEADDIERVQCRRIMAKSLPHSAPILRIAAVYCI